MISDNISWIVTYPTPHAWWGALRDKALKAKMHWEAWRSRRCRPIWLSAMRWLPGPVLCVEELNCWTRRPGF